MSNPSKKKGTRGETRVARYLSSHGLPTTRKALAGSADEGDLRMVTPGQEEITLEVKAGIQTAGYSRGLFCKWLDQSEIEGKNSGCRSALVIVIHHRSLVNAEVWIPNRWWFGHEGWTMMFLDDFAKWMTGG